jgi:glycosyltransferase involved in cell wall biosynthesis
MNMFADSGHPSIDRVHRRFRVGIVCDLREENWPSMDLVSDMLLRYLGTGASDDVQAVALRPAMARRLTRLPLMSTRQAADRVDRVLNRFYHYPRWLERQRDGFDLFHIVDHSYSHLVHVLPAERTVVTCHDTDAFLSLVDPELTHSRLPSLLARRVLSGMRKAARVTSVSRATDEELRRYALVRSDRLAVVYNGVHPAYSPTCDPDADRWLAGIVGDPGHGRIDLLHVGSTIPRKRIDLLLQIFAAVRMQCSGVRLLKAGGEFTADQRELLRSLRIERDVVTLPLMSPAQLAAVYRRASVVLVPSEREGFGLPVVEAMACGTPVVATDLPVLREIGEMAGVYRPLGDIASWRDAVLDVVREGGDHAARALRLARCIERAGLFSWEQYATSMAAIYRDVWTEAHERNAAPILAGPSSSAAARFLR